MKLRVATGDLYFNFISYFKAYFITLQITKIVRALGLAERYVCMRVCKHGL